MTIEKYDVAAFYWSLLHHDERWAVFFPYGSQGEGESIRSCKPRRQGHWPTSHSGVGVCDGQSNPKVVSPVKVQPDRHVNKLLIDVAA